MMHTSLFFLCLSASSIAIRLAGTGSTQSEGRVEVNYNNRGWGTVCDDLWSVPDGDVACRMLGFQAALAIKFNAQYGKGVGSIWLDNVICEGTEASLLDCSHQGVNVHNCQHGEDASVLCTCKCVCVCACELHTK